MPPNDKLTVTGFLVDGINYPGGDGTGWELETTDAGNIEVDVGRVAALARNLRQQRVAITGHYTTRDYTERGPIETFVAEQIRLISDVEK